MPEQLLELKKLFYITYGNKLDLNKMIPAEVGTNFVGRTSKNNGVVGIVKELQNLKPYKAGLITVSLGGSVLSSFVQPAPFYTAQNVVVLEPHNEMNLKEKLFYCICISKNRYRYEAFGREANRTIKELKVPINVPYWVYNTKVPSYEYLKSPYSNTTLNLNIKNWKKFKYIDLFDIKRGTTFTRRGVQSGNTPCITNTSFNNGVSDFLDIKPTNERNRITVSCKGDVGDAFYQPIPYFSVNDIATLTTKFKLNVYIGLFLTTLIKKEKFKYGFGREWSMERMRKSVIKLPVDEAGEPDWEFMENYIKSLPYSSNL